eukprot:scaffold30176_cov131-Skeletonema_dohrnii-CCMP3373.AAC.2
MVETEIDDEELSSIVSEHQVETLPLRNELTLPLELLGLFAAYHHHHLKIPSSALFFCGCSSFNLSPSLLG